jgi:hypothetical protein
VLDVKTRDLGEVRHHVDGDQVRESRRAECDQRCDRRPQIQTEDHCDDQDRRDLHPDQPVVDRVRLGDRPWDEPGCGGRRARNRHHPRVTLRELVLLVGRQLGREAEVGDRGRTALARAGDDAERVHVRKRARPGREAGQTAAVEPDRVPDDPPLLDERQTVRIALDDGDPRQQRRAEQAVGLEFGLPRRGLSRQQGLHAGGRQRRDPRQALPGSECGHAEGGHHEPAKRHDQPRECAARAAGPDRLGDGGRRGVGFHDGLVFP